MRQRVPLSQEEREALDWAEAGSPAPFSVHSPRRVAYPITTEDVAALLTERGYSAHVGRLCNLIQSGLVTPERDSEGKYRWNREDVDTVAHHLEMNHEFSPIYVSAYMEGYDPLQEQLAFYNAFRRTRIREAGEMVMITLPDNPALPAGAQRKVVIYLSRKEFDDGCNSNLSRLIESSIVESNTDSLMERYSQHLQQEQVIYAQK